MQPSELIYIEVLLPLALPKTYTYSVPVSLMDEIKFGIRVEVSLKNKFYSGLIIKILDNGFIPPYKTKNIISIIDKTPIILSKHLELWLWIAEYYMCTLGEVMNAALPAGLKMSSETIVEINISELNIDIDLTDDEYLVYEALQIQKKLNIKEIHEIIGKKQVQGLISQLINKGMVSIREEMLESYIEKKEKLISLNCDMVDEIQILELLEMVKKSKHKTNVILAFMQLSNAGLEVSKNSIMKKAGVNSTIIKQMIDKGILIESQRSVSRLKTSGKSTKVLSDLSDLQSKIVQNIEKVFESKNHLLLHGVTGSGKTRIYQEFIKKIVSDGGQVLYLVPEIGLTTQLISRLTDVFGDDVYIFHSRLNPNERVEIWNSAAKGKPIILAARSGLFLPYSNLKMIIIDEEHDSSFKQQSPTPHYNARDVAAYMGQYENIKVIFGSATPSLETIYNCKTGKYGYVSLTTRYGDVSLPEIRIVDMKIKSLLMPDNTKYSIPLATMIQSTINSGEQVILFQNRRGYSPTVICNQCDWTAKCPNCDVSLTYHKKMSEMKCHYCGYRHQEFQLCPSCRSSKLNYLGYGTEKIELELTNLFPDLKIKRMDLDTTRTKSEIEKIMIEFENQEIDILVGTQMITKGLDFEKIGLVGIIDFDRLTQFPDFRANERAFQLAMQVGGRAGRRNKQGMVIVQTYTPENLIIKDLINHDFDSFTERELKERELFSYPPFCRIIELAIFHRKAETCFESAKNLQIELSKIENLNVIGPSIPGIARIKGYYQYNILIKIDRNYKNLKFLKRSIKKVIEKTDEIKALRSARISVDVDPY